MVSSLTPGKIIILGEYAVLEGAPALVSAVDKYVKISISKSAKNFFYVNAPNLNISQLPFEVDTNSKIIYTEKPNDLQISQLQLFSNIFIYIYNYFKSNNKKLIPCNISIDSGDFYFEYTKSKIGLGSSAAITVGLIKNLMEFNSIYVSTTDELFQLALKAHYQAQNHIGSGIDVAASTFGNLGSYQKNDKSISFKPLISPSGLSFIPIWTGSSTSTPQFVLKTNQLKKSEPEKYNKLMNRLYELADEGSVYFKQNDVGNFLEIVDQYYQSLINLGENAGIPIISETHKQIASIIKKCGGYYKPSGAGGSDIGIAFTDDPTIKKNIIEKIKKSPFKYIKLELIENKNVAKD